MEDAIMALIPFIADKVGSSFATPRSESAAPSGQPHTPVSIPTLPVPRNTAPVETHSSGPRLVIPFQQEWYGLTGTETGSASITMSELSAVKDIIKFYQNATLIEVEAAVFAYAPSVDKPLTVELAWTPANVTVGSSAILGVPGGCVFTVGGLNVTNGGLLPAPLQQLNPVVKSPIPYDNQPRINIKFHQIHTTVQNKRTAAVVIRGTLAVDTPTIYK